MTGKKTQVIIIILAGFLTIASFGFCESLVIDDTGNVGIGETDPGAMLSFPCVDANYNAVGITWYSPSPLRYGIYKSEGPWSSPNYQQLMFKWYTGIEIDGGDYGGKSGTIIQPGAGNVGIGTRYPSYKLFVNGTARVTTLIQSSDKRLKKDIKTSDNSLEKLTKLRGVRYKWNELAQEQRTTDPLKEENSDSQKSPLISATEQLDPNLQQQKMIPDDREHLGLIAQEVEQVYPEVVYTDENGMKSIAYSQLIGPLIEAVKELKSENKILKLNNNELIKGYDDIKNQLAELKAIVKKTQRM